MAQTEQPMGVSAQPTFIDIILDETGSMNGPQTKSGFNDFIADQKSVVGECYLTLTKFDSNGIRTPYENLSLKSVPKLCFEPGAMTNLYDVVGERLSKLLEQQSDHRRLVVVITDGCDNSSRTYTASNVSDRVRDARNAGISVLYFGADQRAAEIGQSMGFTDSEINVFDVANIEQAMVTVSKTARAFRATA